MSNATGAPGRAESVALMTGRRAYGFALGAHGALARVQLALREPAADIEQTLRAYAAAIEHTGMRALGRDLAELRALTAERAR